MTVEATIFAAIQSLVGGRCYPDLAPELTARPYITFQQVGGEAINYVEQAVPSLTNARFQVNVWGDTRSQVAPLAKQVESTLRLSAALQTTVLGSPVATYDPETKLRGTRQDFSLWT